MYYVVWQYKVDAANQAKFEEMYSRQGPWFKLFEPCDEYLGHELIKNMNEDSYLLIDKWMDKSDFETFYKSKQLEYDALNEETRALYSEETKLGDYQTLG